MEKIIKKVKDARVFLNPGESAAAGKLKVIIQLSNTADNITIYNTDAASAEISLKDFKKVLDILENPTVTDLKENNKLEILKDNSKISIDFDYRKKEVITEAGEKEIIIKAADIKKMVQLRKDITGGTINYVAITKYGFSATDSYRLGILKSDIKVNDVYLIPYSVIDLIENEKKIKLSQDKTGKYQIELDDLKIQFNNFLKNFPGIDSILKTASNLSYNITFNKKELEKTLKKVNKIAIECQEKYRIQLILNKTTTITATNKTMEIEQQIKALQTCGESIKIAFNSSFLLDFLKRVVVEEVTMNYYSTNTMVNFNTDDYQYILMPMAWRDQNDK